MKFHLTSAKLTGTPGESGWSQIHEFKPDDEEKLKLRGHLFAVISTGKGEEGVESVAVGRELLARLHEEYFGDTELTAFNALKKSVEKVIEEFSNGIGNIEIAAASFVEGTIYSAAGGGSQAAIYRDGMLATILQSEKGSVISASGHPKKGDLLLLGSSKFFAEVGKGILKAALEGGDSRSAVEQFAPMVHAKDETGNLGLAVVGFGEEREISSIEMEKPEEDLARVPEKEEEKQERKVEIKGSSIGFFDRAKSFLRNKLPGKKIYVRKGEAAVEDVQKKKTAVSIGVILLILLFVSIIFGVRQARIKAERERYESRLTEARHKLEEARSLFTLNPERARELFSQSSRIVEELEGEGVEDKQLLALKEEIQKGRQSVLGEHDVTAEQFLDLSLIEGFRAEALSATAERIYVLDDKRQRVAEVVISTKKTQVIAGPSQINEADDIASYAGRAFILEDNAVYEVGDSRQEAVENGWQDPLIYAYAGNLYVIDRGTSEILRYSAISSGFSSGSSWLAPGIEPDLSNVISWAIDGSIWILTSTGKIEKYTLGSPQVLGEMVVSPPMQNPSIIYTNEELDFVYLLDPETSRVVVFDKDGNYKAQYKSGLLKEAISIAVSEEEGKIIFLTKEKLYSISIEHSS